MRIYDVEFTEILESWMSEEENSKRPARDHSMCDSDIVVTNA